MTDRPSRPRSLLRYQLALLIGAPLAILLATEISARWAGEPPPPQAQLERIRAGFDRFLLGAGAIADDHLPQDPDAAVLPVGPDDTLEGRLEGIGWLRSRDGKMKHWLGTPTRPGEHFTVPASPRFRIRRDGTRTRLIVRGGPSTAQATLGAGTHTIVSFALSSEPEGLEPEALFSAEPLDGYQYRVDFTDYHFGHDRLDRWQARTGWSADEATSIPLVSPEGLVLGSAQLVPLNLERRAEQLRELGRSWALLVALLAAATLFDWRRISGRPGYAALTALALLIGRHLLVLASATSRLLPRPLGSPTLYGSTDAAGWIASPADLAATGLTLCGLCLIAQRLGDGWFRRERRGAAVAVSAMTAMAAALAAAWLTTTLIRDARIDILASPAWDRPELARLLLVLGWVVVMLGAAGLAGSVVSWLRGRGSTSWLRPIPLTLFAVLVALGCTKVYQGHEQLVLERLRTEFQPMIEEQSPRRVDAVTETVRTIQQELQEQADLSAASDLPPRYLAHAYWVDSELFQNGYRSSLELFREDGARISRFGFDIPPYPEPEGAVELPPEQLTHYWEQESEFSPRLLVAEAPVLVEGNPSGRVVARVVDEPDNLPFLPGNQPYLSALGSGSPTPFSGPLAGGLDLVLFDPDGTVDITTIDEPPAFSADLVEAAADDAALDLRAGERHYFGTALLHDDRLHLLLVPRPARLARLVSVARIWLLGVFMLAATTALRALYRGDGLGGAWRSIRSSFYRRLLAAMLVASIVPLLGLAALLSSYVQRRAESDLIRTATQYARSAQRLIEDYGTAQTEGGWKLEEALSDANIHWLSGVVGQELHIFIEGRLAASSQSELYESGVLPRQLHSDIQRTLFDGGLSYLVQRTRFGPNVIPVAYTRVRDPTPNTPERIVAAIPLLRSPEEVREGVRRIREMILLATASLVLLLAFTAARIARNVAEPVRALVRATGRIADGDYAARLRPQTHDEVAELVEGFNRMASALADQRRDVERRREYTESLVRFATTGVISTDGSGRVVKINPAALQLLDAAGPLDHGDPLVQRLAASASLQPLAEAMSRPADAEPREVELEIEDGPGRRFQLVRIELGIPGSNEVGTLILIEDVTERMRSNQLEAWAEMARAIAHEIKNPLTPIQLSADHLRRLLTDRGLLPDASVEACLDTVMRQVRSLHDIAGEFSAYAKLPALELTRCNPLELMQTTIRSYQSAPPPGISIEEEYVAAPEVMVDERVLGRALVNLIENAIHAMPEGGTLTAQVRPSEDGQWVELAIRDDGTGIAPEARRRLFEPYFSTKSSGTGLGLAIVNRTVEAHRGRVEVESTRGKGSTFRILIPSTAAELAAG